MGIPSNKKNRSTIFPNAKNTTNVIELYKCLLSYEQGIREKEPGLA
jgi:hypothetical protein